MSKIYLSPSTQEFNNYLNGGTEEEYMNKLADLMEPYLLSSGISFTRNTPDMTAASSIRQSNEGHYDLHLALHSNAAPEFLAGKLRGTEVYYYPRSVKGKEAADIITNNLKTIYPKPNLVKAIPTTNIGEVRRTKAPAVLIEIAYHDNAEDEKLIKDNLEEIAINIAKSVAQFLGLPFVLPVGEKIGTVVTKESNLNIRSKPSLNAEIIGSIPKGSKVTVLGGIDDWYTVKYGDTLGFANAKYIML